MRTFEDFLSLIMDKVSQSYWDHSYSGYNYAVASDVVTNWLKKHVPNVTGTVFEAGCFPGRYLAWLGKLGWTVSGMDLTPRMETDFRDWLQRLEIKHSRIERGDVMEYMRETPDRYDLVCSFGFIEHFKNFEEVISLHARLVKPGGHLIITVPHFRGFVQRTLHSWLDKENSSRHHLPSMNPVKWSHQLGELGFSVKWSGYFGNFDFWADKEKRGPLKKFGLEAINLVKPALRWLPNSKLYSPYCGIVAKLNN